MFGLCACCGLPSMQLAFDLSGQPRQYDSEAAAAIHAATAAVASTALRAQEARLGLAAEESKLAKAAEEFLAQAEKVRNLRRERDEAAEAAAQARKAIYAGGAAGKSAHATTPNSERGGSLMPVASLDPALYEPMASWTFATWRLALSRPVAHQAQLPRELYERLDGVWAHCRTLLETTGANSLQLTSYFESQFPYEFNLLAHAAVGV